VTEPIDDATFAHVRDPGWLRERDLFVAEGRFVTRRLLESARIHTLGILLTPTAQAVMADAIAAVPQAMRPAAFVKSQADLDAITGFRMHQGCVAIARRPTVATTLPHDLDGPIVALERVRDPDNVGSIIRSGAALGGGGLLLGPECADPYYRKAVRTSMGAVFTWPIACTPALPEGLRDLQARGRVLVALTPDIASPSLADARAQAGSRPAILLLGSEGDGVSPEVRRLADIEARIPMSDLVDSLNVAMAAGVARYAWRHER